MTHDDATHLLETVQILVLESALERSKEYVARCAQRSYAAKQDVNQAVARQQEYELQLKDARTRFLARAL